MGKDKRAVRRLRLTLTEEHYEWLLHLSNRLGHGTVTRTAGQLVSGIVEILAGRQPTESEDDNEEIRRMFSDLSSWEEERRGDCRKL